MLYLVTPDEDDAFVESFIVYIPNEQRKVINIHCNEVVDGPDLASEYMYDVLCHTGAEKETFYFHKATLTRLSIYDELST